VDTAGFLRRLSEATGVSGHEQILGDFVASMFLELGADVRKDRLDNVIARFNGTGSGQRPSVMFAAHMDEVGLMITEIDDKGFLRFTAIGVDPRTLLAQEVVVHGREDVVGVVGTRPPHLSDASQRNKAIPIEDQFIDTGLGVEEVKKLVRVGDTVTPRRRVANLHGKKVAGKALDDRAGVAAMYEAAQRLAGLRHECDVYFVATVMEEVGLRGAMVSTYSIVPDIGIAIDVGFAEYPGQSGAGQDLEYGKGPSVALGANIHPAVHRLLKSTAEDHKIPYQVEPIPSRSGTDAWAMQVTRAGIPTGVLSIPLRYMHTSVEVVDMRDVVETGRLLAHLASRITRETVEGLQHA